jgi:hypothetical protein
MDALPPSLAPLAAWDQFVCWFAVPDADKPGKYKKFPASWETGAVVDAHDPRHWTNAATAVAMHAQYDRGHGSGVGFVFTEQDPFFFHDIDNALLADGSWAPLAQNLCAHFAGAAMEVSHSGRGLHIFGTGVCPPHGTVHTPAPGQGVEKLELYTAKRFAALTGTNAQGDASKDCTAALSVIAPYYFPAAARIEAGAWTTEPVAEWRGPDDDDELIRRAMIAGQRNANAVFGDKLTFAKLWTGEVGDIGRSEADQTLANHLAFWTGKSCERMERLMRASGLLRDKWDAPGHANYLSNTILKACAFVTSVANSPEPAPSVVPPPPLEVQQAAAVTAGRTLREAGREYLDGVDQLDHFDGCTFVTELSKVYSLTNNAFYARPAFDVAYGGHLFSIDPMNSARPTASAWEAFTLSRIYAPPIVEDICFRPREPAGGIVLEGNRRLLNAYVPHTPEMADGDPAPFLGWLAKVLPDARDREILLSYMASLAQNPGVKFQWWPVLQGVEGNGKTMVVRLMQYIMGRHYSHLPNTMAMAKDGMKFNGWIHRKLFVGLEEVAVEHKREFLEELKVIVTNEDMGVEKKGVEQIMADNFANGMICTNYRNGVPVEKKNRRYGVFFTAQQHEDDLARDGMLGNYFPDLYDWFHGRRAYAGAPSGKAIMARFLKTMAVAYEMDPAGGLTRAPQTSSTVDAIAASMGRAEQEVLEAIDEGRPGFSGGWVSSRFLDALLDGMRPAAPVQRNKRRALMQALGYDWHPLLTDGRVNDVVAPDGAKPKLYVRAGHEALGLPTAAAVAHAYSAAQAPSPVTVHNAAVVAFGPPPTKAA